MQTKSNQRMGAFGEEVVSQYVITRKFEIIARNWRIREGEIDIIALHHSAMSFLHDELEREHITARGLHKIVRVAWTLADLHAHEIPTLADVTQAHLMRAGVEP